MEFIKTKTYSLNELLDHGPLSRCAANHTFYKKNYPVLFEAMPFVPSTNKYNECIYVLSDELRGRYHLDHRFSGFQNNILPYHIGDINNLEFIPASENCSKGAKCSITKEELFRWVELP